MIINMWSGPRNLSTVLMRSFENRDDTKVWDEPLYAYYLKKTKLNHPIANQIIDNYETNIDILIKEMTYEDNNLNILYLKQMTHHLLDETPINWIKKGKNCLLIRRPEKVIASYIKKNELKSSNDIGFPSQYKIYQYLKKYNQEIVVINAEDLINSPAITLKLLCKKLNIVFTKKMLKWPQGTRKSDGIWGKIWYKKVINSNTFNFQKLNKEIKTPTKYNLILNECYEIYNELNLYNLNNEKINKQI